MPAGAGRLLGGGEKGRSDAVPRAVGVNADLLDVGIAVEHLQPDEPEGRVPLVYGNQEQTVLESRAVSVRFRRWSVGYAVHASSSKQPVA